MGLEMLSYLNSYVCALKTLMLLLSKDEFYKKVK